MNRKQPNNDDLLNFFKQVIVHILPQFLATAGILLLLIALFGGLFL